MKCDDPRRLQRWLCLCLCVCVCVCVVVCVCLLFDVKLFLFVVLRVFLAEIRLPVHRQL